MRGQVSPGSSTRAVSGRSCQQAGPGRACVAWGWVPTGLGAQWGAVGAAVPAWTRGGACGADLPLAVLLLEMVLLQRRSRVRSET